MLRNTYGNQCVSVWDRVLLDTVDDHPKQVLTFRKKKTQVQKRCLEQTKHDFQFPIQGLIWREGKISIPTANLPVDKRLFYKTLGGKSRSPEPPMWCPPSSQWTAMASWKTNKTTVALWSVHLLFCSSSK